MITTERTITICGDKSKIDEPILLYRGDFEVQVKFKIFNSKYKFQNGLNLIAVENAAYGQLAILGPNGENVFSDITKCVDGTVSFVVTETMIDELKEVGKYSFQIRLFDANRDSRVTIPPVEFGLIVGEPVASEDTTELIDEALAGYSIARATNVNEPPVGPTFDGDRYNKTDWEAGDRITTDKLNKLEDAVDTINRNDLNSSDALNKQMTSNFNVLQEQINEVAYRGTNAEIVQRTVTNELKSLTESGLINLSIEDGSIDVKKVDFFGYPFFNEYISSNIFCSNMKGICAVYHRENSKYKTKMIDVHNDRIEIKFNSKCNRFIVGSSKYTQSEIKSQVENLEGENDYFQASLLYNKTDDFIFDNEMMDIKVDHMGDMTIVKVTPLVTTKTIIIYYSFSDEGIDTGADVTITKSDFVPILNHDYLGTIPLDKLDSNSRHVVDITDLLVETNKYYLTYDGGAYLYRKANDDLTSRRCFLLELKENTAYSIKIENADFGRVITFDRTLEQMLNINYETHANNVIEWTDDYDGETSFINTSDKIMVIYPYLTSNTIETNITVTVDGYLFDSNVVVQNLKDKIIGKRHLSDELLNDIKSSDLLTLDFWTPPDQPNSWATDDTNGNTGAFNGNSDDFCNEFYDKYIGEYASDNVKNSSLQNIEVGEEEPSYVYKVTKDVLGKDHSDTYNLYKYIFSPTKYKKTILLSSLMHTYELPAGFGLARFIYYIMEEPDIHPSIRYIRDNVRIIVIPIINPWGFNQPSRKYGNVNGVNINRDFGYYGDPWEEHPNYTVSNTNEWNQRGDAVFSQKETQHVAAVLKQHANELDFWIDLHTGKGWDHDIWCYSCFSDTIFRPKILNTADWLTQQWKNEGMPCNKNRLVEGRESHKLRYAFGYLGVPCATLEYVPQRFGGKFNGSMDIFQYLRKLANFVIGGLNELSEDEELTLLKDKTYKRLLRIDLGE